MTMTPYNPDLTRSLKWMQNNAPNLQMIIQNKANWYQKYHTQFWSDWQTQVFDIRTANAFGLVVWCIILGIPLDLFDFSPITNAFAFGAQRGNYIDGGGNTEPIIFVTTPVLYGNGVAIPTSSYTLNETTDAVAFRAAPVTGTILSWTATVQSPTTGQQMKVQQPRVFGTGNGSQVNFSLIPSDSENFNEVGNNFYGGGNATVGLLTEIRQACQMRYITLVSNGRQQWINQMLQYVFNSGQPWSFPNKEYFYLTDGTQAVQNVVAAILQEVSWAGTVPLSPNPRTNLVTTSTGLVSSGHWTASGCTATAVAGPDGVASSSASLTAAGAGGTYTGPAAALSVNQVYTASCFVNPRTSASAVLTCGGAQATLTFGSNPSIVVTGGAGQASIVAATNGWYLVQFSFNSGISSSAAFVADVNTQTYEFAYPQIELGAVAGHTIKTTTVAVTQTDYTLNVSTGAVVTGFTPGTTSTLYWSGTWQWATTVGFQEFGTGNGSNVNFTLTPPPGAVPPVTQTNYMEYRIGANMGVSSQFLNIMNNPAYGIMPQCAGTRYAVVQES